MDAYDFADPVDVLGRLDKTFWEGLSSPKWSERRDALQNLKQLASSPKLAPGDYADIVRELRKVKRGCTCLLLAQGSGPTTRTLPSGSIDAIT